MDVDSPQPGFYRKYSKRILLLVLLSFPFLFYQAETLKSNNDIETWLPDRAEVRISYEEFKQDFGAEEVILVGLADASAESRIVEALASRIEALPGIRGCWTSDRFGQVMEEMEVPPEAVPERVRGLVVSEDGNLTGIIAVLSEEGLNSRAQTVEAIRSQIAYCQLPDEEAFLAGSPVLVAELDRLGSRKSNKKFFMITLLISLLLLYHSLRQWKLTFAILGLTIWSINATLTVINLAGAELNFILGALPVMVMVFTLAIAIHMLHYYQSAADAEEPDPLTTALGRAWKPCVLATLTTTIGLVSLNVSSMAPVRDFGVYAAAGCLVALFTGLGLTPAVMTLWPPGPHRKHAHRDGRPTRAAIVSSWIITHRKQLAIVTCLMVGVTSFGLYRVQSKIEPLEFLPRDSKILSDALIVERDLTNSRSVEAVIDFGHQDLPFLEKLAVVREAESIIRKHPGVRHTISVATFFPEEMPDSTFAAASLLNRARERQSNNDFLADGDRYWRISARLNSSSIFTDEYIVNDLRTMTTEYPIRYTGISPLLKHAQTEIFQGFWESFATAFIIITFVMIVSLRSWRTGLVAMVPNLTPICLVFGTLGWIRFPVDIGMMMTASIALGIAVDGTFHFLVRYHEVYRRDRNSEEAARISLMETGVPIFQAAGIASLGMLALTLSNFVPTARFGFLMATLLMTALIGDLLLLPALLAMRPKRNRNSDEDKAEPAETTAKVPAPNGLLKQMPASSDKSPV